MGDLVGLLLKTGLYLKTYFLKQTLQKKYQKNHNHSSPSGTALLVLLIKRITAESYQIPVKLLNTQHLHVILPNREKGSESLFSKMVWIKASL